MQEWRHITTLVRNNVEEYGSQRNEINNPKMYAKIKRNNPQLNTTTVHVHVYHYYYNYTAISSIAVTTSATASPIATHPTN